MKLRRKWKPSGFLRHAEDLAVKIRKELGSWRSPGEAIFSASKGEAARLADLIADIARFGQSQPGKKAAEIAERVEPLLDLLTSEIDELLSSGR
jgi:hypothetical protein